jgi:hypothetical protein
LRPAAGEYEISASDHQTRKERWATIIPVRVRAMAAAGPAVFVADPRDVVDARDPWAAIVADRNLAPVSEETEGNEDRGIGAEARRCR